MRADGVCIMATLGGSLHILGTAKCLLEEAATAGPLFPLVRVEMWIRLDDLHEIGTEAFHGPTGHGLLRIVEHILKAGDIGAVRNAGSVLRSADLVKPACFTCLQNT